MKSEESKSTISRIILPVKKRLVKIPSKNPGNGSIVNAIIAKARYNLMLKKSIEDEGF
jgi:hypothetical protein